MSEIPARLDPQSWLDRPGFPGLLDLLGADEGLIKLVGGSVRDGLLGMQVSDLDLATRLLPEEVIERASTAGIKCVPTGLKHGTVTIIVGNQPHEITTLRRDVATDGRHAEVAFTGDWKADAARRDFTINALYAHPLTGEVDDYFGGLADLASRSVRFIGEPLERIAEDHLRIMRFFRFSARYARQLDPAGLAACQQRANDLMALSRERVRDELLKLLALPAPAGTLRAMLDHGIFAPILPEVDVAGLHCLERLIAAEAAAVVEANAIRRLAAILPADPAQADSVAARFKLSKVCRARLVAAADRSPVGRDPRALAYAVGAPAALDRLLLTQDQRARQWAGPFADWHRPRLPISGKDLIAMGLPPGPAVSRRLGEVEQRWIDAGFPANEHAVLAIARDVLGIA